MPALCPPRARRPAPPLPSPFSVLTPISHWDSLVNGETHPSSASQFHHANTPSFVAHIEHAQQAQPTSPLHPLPPFQSCQPPQPEPAVLSRPATIISCHGRLSRHSLTLAMDQPRLSACGLVPGLTLPRLALPRLASHPPLPSPRVCASGLAVPCAWAVKPVTPRGEGQRRPRSLLPGPSSLSGALQSVSPSRLRTALIVATHPTCRLV